MKNYFNFSELSNKSVLIVALVVGLVIGAGVAGLRTDKAGTNKFKSDMLKSDIRVSSMVKVTAKGCHSLKNEAELMDAPTALSGRILNKIPLGACVAFLGQEESKAPSSKEGITKAELQLRKLFKTYHIPAGTKFTLKGYDSSEGGIVLRMPVEGKIRNVVVQNYDDVILGYTGMWKKVKFHGQVGYVRGDYLSDVSQIPEEELQ